MSDVQKIERNTTFNNHTRNLWSQKRSEWHLLCIWYSLPPALGTFKYRSFRRQPLPKKELWHTTTNSLKVIAFKSTNYITCLRYFCSNHCSEYKCLFKLAERIWKSFLICLEGELTEKLWLYTDFKTWLDCSQSFQEFPPRMFLCTVTCRVKWYICKSIINTYLRHCCGRRQMH